MIVRILGEGQLQVDDSATEELNALDAKLEAAVDGGDEPAFAAARDELLQRVRELGSPVDADVIRPSQLILPGQDATMADVRRLLSDEGLIPG